MSEFGVQWVNWYKFSKVRIWETVLAVTPWQF
jgi:hypothetical protein